MTFRLDLRKTGNPWHDALIDGFCFVCGWCGQRFFTAADLCAHVREERTAA